MKTKAKSKTKATRVKRSAARSKTKAVRTTRKAKSTSAKRRRTALGRLRLMGRKSPFGESTRHARKAAAQAWPWWIPLTAASVFGVGALIWNLNHAPEAGDAAREPAGDRREAPTASADEGRFDVLSARPTSVRIQAWSEAVASLADPQALKRWVGEPTGLPASTDSAPLIPAKFDCTTFVETVAALSRSRTASDFYRNLLAIRYKGGNPNYFYRNHFPEADWIPNNQAAGILRDVTTEFAAANGARTQTVFKTIDRGRWFAGQRRFYKDRTPASVQAPDAEWTKPVRADVPYIPLADLTKILDKISSGTVVNFVQARNPRSPVLIIHQGILVRENGQLMLRHASIHGVMQTVPFTEYLENATALDGSRLKAVIGVNLNEIQG